MSDAAKELLRDSFTRLVEHVDELTDGLSDEMSWWQPVAGANSIIHFDASNDLTITGVNNLTAGDFLFA